MKYKFLSILLAIALIIGVNAVSLSASAAESETEELSASAGSVTLSGTRIYNLNDNNYTIYGKPVNSYLTELSDGSLERVQYNTSGKILIEKYSSDGRSLKSSLTLSKELSNFAGFYSGKNYNFLVFANSNYAENNSAEVFRVVKYSKNWARVSSASIRGVNTVEAAASGSLRMAEANGVLYIHTCHIMYKTYDGLNHQANMTFAINENNMSVKEQYSGIMNIDDTGYVSHSFNQFVQTDSSSLYRVDHGDAHPRGISITKASLNGSFTKVKVSIPVNLSYTGNIGENQTGASVGGFELSDNNCLIAFNSVDFTKQNVGYDGVRNIYISVTNKELTQSKNIKLTNYAANGNITAQTPQLVKLKNNKFLVMWSEVNKNTLDGITKLALINDSGQIIGNTVSTNMPLSDCKPVLCGDGLVKWFVGDRNFVNLYLINPENLNGTPAVPALPKPGVPEVLKLENTRQGLNVTVNQASLSVYNLIYYKTAAQKNWSQIKINKNTCTLTGLQSGALYYVQTQSFDFYGPSGEFSKVKSMTYLAPAEITSLRYNNGNSLSWSKVNGANKYQIAVLKSGDNDFKYYTATGTSFTDKNIAANNKYAYQVRAMYQTSGSGTAYGAWSPAKTITVPSTSTKPALSVANYRDGIGVVWSSVPNVNNYNVFYRAKSDNAWSKMTVTGTSGVVTKVTSGQLYYIQVQPMLSNGGGRYSDVKSMTALSTANITNLSYNGNCSLSWSPVKGANKYQIARIKKGYKTFDYFYSDTTSFVERNADGGTVYTYQVRPMYQTANNGTAYGAWSVGRSVTTLVAPTAKLSKSSSGLTLSWNSIRGAKKYEIILMKGSASNFSEFETANLSYTFNALEKRKIYVAYVRAVSGDIKGPLSVIQSIEYK